MYPTVKGLTLALGVTDLKKGQVFQLDGIPYRVVDYSQKVMGRGGSIVNVKIKSVIDGKVMDKTFKGNETLEAAEITNKTAQYLYSDGTSLHFMDEKSYEQFEIPTSSIKELVDLMKDGSTVQLQLFKGSVINVELPKNVALKVTQAEDAVKGDTSSAITKDAQLETGITIKVPAFIKTGDIISVDTTTKAYRERLKN